MASGRVFISYSHKDIEWIEKIKIHLKPYVRNMSIDIWDDSQIQPGTLWRDEIEKALKSANIAVLLVSPHFLSSDFIVEHELPPLLNAAQKRGLTILWVPVSSSSYAETDIAHYQAMHDPKRPLDKLNEADQNEVLVEICKKIREISDDRRVVRLTELHNSRQLGTESYDVHVERILRELALHCVFSPMKTGFARSPLEMIKEAARPDDLTAIMAQIPPITSLEEQIRFVREEHFADKYADSWVDKEVQIIGARVLQDIETYLTTSPRVYDIGCGNRGQYKAILSLLGKPFAQKGEYWGQDYNEDWYSFFKVRNGRFVNKPLPDVAGADFDLVTCAHVLQDMTSNLIAIYTSFFSFNKLLKENGVCYITVPYKDSQPGILDVLETAARGAQFNVLARGHFRLVITDVVERHDPLGITTFSYITLTKKRDIDSLFWQNLLGASFFRWEDHDLGKKYGVRGEGDIEEDVLLIERDLKEVLVERNHSVRRFRWIINRLFECRKLWQEAILRRSGRDVAAKIRKHIHKLHDVFINPHTNSMELEGACAKYLSWLLLWLFNNCQPLNKQTILSTINPIVEENLRAPRDIRVHIDDLSKDHVARLIRHLFELCEAEGINIKHAFNRCILAEKSLD